LGRRPLVTENYREFFQVQGDSRLQAQVAIHHLAVAARQQGDLEAEFANGGHHLLHGLIVASWIARVGAQSIGPANFYLHGRFSELRLVASCHRLFIYPLCGVNWVGRGETEGEIARGFGINQIRIGSAGVIKGE